MEIKRAMVKTGIIMSHESNSMGLAESEQRELLVWFCKNKPELIGEVVCIPDCAFLQENK
jgi:hypothetical protein